MLHRKFIWLIAIALMGIGLVAVPPTAQAAENTAWSYAGYTGGTRVKVANGTVQSDLTAQSGVTGAGSSKSSKNSTAAGKVGGLVEVGAIETTTDAKVTKDLLGGGTTTTLTSWARTAGVNLLGGLITADAVETNIKTVLKADGSSSHTASSNLANIKIAGINLPLNIPKNYTVTIPGIATVTMNYALHGQTEEMTVTTGWALTVTLLAPHAGYDTGATIFVNPVWHGGSEVPPEGGAKLIGSAYGTRVQADVGSEVSVVSDPTARVLTPTNSSNGRKISNATLGVRVPGLLTTGIVTSSTVSTKDLTGDAEITNINRTANVNILGGLITAKAIEVRAINKVVDGKWTHSEEMELVDLVVAGQAIPINVGPNTTIDVAGLGKVEINKQQSNNVGAYQNMIYGLRITLDTSQAGLPVGAVVELGTAYSSISQEQ